MRMLAVDGGGVRGIVPLVWLMRLEAVTGKRVQELFDAFIGTSIGAAIVCGLSLGHRPDDLLAMLQEDAPLIFPRGWPWVRNRLARVATEGFSAPRYDARPLYDFMGKLYGDRTFSAVESPTIVTSYDITRRQLRVLRSWNLTDPHGGPGGRLYQTCLSVMTLEVYYRHLPIYQREKLKVEY